MDDLTHTNESSSSLSEPSKQVVVEVTYTADGVRREGLRGWRLMLKGMVDSRRLIWLLMLRDISVRYRQSVLGYAWAVLPPVVTVGVFAFLNASRVLPIGETTIPYMAYALWGITVWQLFAGCLSACTNSLSAGGSLVTKINFGKEALVIAAIGQPLFEFLIRLIPVIFVFLWNGLLPTWAFVFMPLVLLPVTLLALGMGFILSVANLAIRDTANALGMVLSVGIFLTPVLYPPPVRWPFFLVNILNPLSPLLLASQDLIAFGLFTRPDTFVISCLFSVLVFLGGWRFFHLTIPRIAEYA
jgi:lipopolysaccharide transport system permease protein